MIGALAFAALAALLYFAAFPPLDFGWIGAVALAPWVAIARRLRGGRLFLVGWIGGLALFTAGCFWLRKSHPLNLVLMVVPEALAFALFVLLLRRLQVTQRWPAMVALPLAFVPIEFARGHFPLDGYPWLSLGYSQHAHLGLVQLAAITGVHGLSFVLALVAGALADAIAVRSRAACGRFVAALALLAIGEVAGRATLGDVDRLPRGPRLLLLQPGIEQALKNAGRSHEFTLRRHVELAELAQARERADLLVWSETFLPGHWRDHDGAVVGEPPDFRDYRAGWRQRVDAEMTRRFGLPLIGGAVTVRAVELRPETPLYNSALLLGRDGKTVAAYDKRLLVPGGEYVPWIDAFPTATAESLRNGIRKMAGDVPNLRPGTRSGVIDLASVGLTSKLGLTICYEIAYPQLGRGLVEDGAQFLLNLSNEAWFPDSAEFAQYSAMAVVRAVETRRTMVRCANSGTSGFVDPWGRPTWLEQNGRRDGFAGSMIVAPPLAAVITPYVRFGDALAWAVTLLAGAAVLVRRRTSGIPRADIESADPAAKA